MSDYKPTAIELEIKRLVYNRWKIQAIADKLGLSVRQVKYRISKLRQKGITVDRWY